MEYNKSNAMTDTRPKVLLLDAGNTIVFLDHEAVAAHLQQAGESVTADDLKRAHLAANRSYSEKLKQQLSHDKAWFMFMDTLLIEAGVHAKKARSRTQLLRRHHDEFNLWRRVPEGLPERLQAIRSAGISLGVVSNSEGKLERLFKRLGLLEYFDALVDSAQVGYRKPDPRIFECALEQFGVAPSDALYAGDLPEVDIAGAQAVGMQAVLIDPWNLYPQHSASQRLDSVHTLCDRILRF